MRDTERERERGAETQAEGAAGSLRGPRCGPRCGTSRTRDLSPGEGRPSPPSQAGIPGVNSFTGEHIGECSSQEADQAAGKQDPKSQWIRPSPSSLIAAWSPWVAQGCSTRFFGDRAPPACGPAVPRYCCHPRGPRPGCRMHLLSSRSEEGRGGAPPFTHGLEVLWSTALVLPSPGQSTATPTATGGETGSLPAATSPARPLYFCCGGGREEEYLGATAQSVVGKVRWRKEGAIQALNSEVPVATFPRIVPEAGGGNKERVSEDVGHIQALRRRTGP